MKLPAATPFADHLLVWIDPESCERTEAGLYVPDWQPGDRDATVAVVAAAPLRLSTERRLEFPHMDGRAYTYADLRGIPRRDDLVFLRPNTFKPELEMPGFPGVFIVALDRVLASVGHDDVLTPFQGLLLCEEVWDDDVRQRPDGTRERSTVIGNQAVAGLRFASTTRLVTEVDPLPISGVLRVLHVGPALNGQPDVVQPGDVVACHPMAFARHAKKQDDIPDATEKVQLQIMQPRRIRIGPIEYAVVPRQLVMGVREKYAYAAAGFTAADLDDILKFPEQTGKL